MTDYALLCEQLSALTEGENDLICNLSNAAALLWHSLEKINWAGFYLVKGEELVLAPFQGKPACRRIAKSRGVCGAAWREGRTQVVPDVHAFAGHIACDADSRSEIVVPLRRGEAVVGVLDIDSPIMARFSDADRVGLEAFAARIEGLF